MRGVLLVEPKPTNSDHNTAGCDHKYLGQLVHQQSLRELQFVGLAAL